MNGSPSIACRAGPSNAREASSPISSCCNISARTTYGQWLTSDLCGVASLAGVFPQAAISGGFFAGGRARLHGAETVYRGQRNAQGQRRTSGWRRFGLNPLSGAGGRWRIWQDWLGGFGGIWPVKTGPGGPVVGIFGSSAHWAALLATLPSTQCGNRAAGATDAAGRRTGRKTHRVRDDYRHHDPYPAAGRIHFLCIECTHVQFLLKVDEWRLNRRMQGRKRSMPEGSIQRYLHTAISARERSVGIGLQVAGPHSATMRLAFRCERVLWRLDRRTNQKNR